MAICTPGQEYEAAFPYYQLPPPPPPKPPPEDPPPEELLDGELTMVELVELMVLEKDLEKECMDWYPLAERYQLGAGTSRVSNLSAHLSRCPNAMA